MITELAFYMFSAVLIVSAGMVVTSRNPVHGVLFLILAFFNAAGLFLIAGAEFLAMTLVIVYVGAVAVLFLFVVMMLDVDFVALRQGFQRYASVGATVGVVLIFELASVLLGWRAPTRPVGLPFVQAIGRVQNTRAIGQVLYTNYILLFQLSGLILLVAMIGAIVLTHRQRQTSRRQNITNQQQRRVADTLQVLQVPRRAGINTLGVFRPEADLISSGAPTQDSEDHSSSKGD